LLLLDDGGADTGEVRWIRGSRHMIGRERGETVIAHDREMSAEHAAITCAWDNGQYRWRLTDLTSANGTLIRVSRALLQDRREMLIGARRYLFLAPTAIEAAADNTRSTARVDDSLAQARLERLSPRLAWLSAGHHRETWRIDSDQTAIGRDRRRCQIGIERDPFVSSVHARIVFDQRGRWTIEDARSLNGVWLRVRKTTIANGAEFQLGEQRFKFFVQEAAQG
jgi:pSer/pThr/pTyr-binding forkhead associated (FHA) protein